MYSRPTPTYNDADFQEGFADWIAQRCGLPVPDAHPPVHEWRRYGTEEVVRAVTGLPANAGMAELSRALTSSDFGNSLASALHKIVSISYGRAARAYSGLLLDLPSRGLYPVRIPTFDLGQLEAQPNAGGAPLALPAITTGETIVPRIWAARFLISRNLLLSDGPEIAGAAVAQLAGHAATLEPRLIGAILTTNANLVDGAPLIGASNTTAGTGLDIAALGQAMAIIRTATSAAGNYTNATPAYLLIPPAKEATAMLLVSSLTYGAQPPALKVLVNPWSGADSYLIADRLDVPTFARVHPAGINPEPSVERIAAQLMSPDGDMSFYDGQGFEFSQYLGVAAIGRRGICRIPAA